MKKHSIIYIDGYNWYHAIFKHYPEWKWLDIQSFFESLRPHEDIAAVKMFSTLIDHDADALERQQKYFQALRTRPKVKIILGIFQPREVKCRGNCGQKYMVPEEKKTDVNLAIEIVDDAINARSDSICVISGDSDVQPAVEWVARNKKEIAVTVYVPALPNEQSARRTDYYKTQGLNVDCKFLPLTNLAEHQFRNIVKLGDGKLAVRPHIWAKASELQKSTPSLLG